MKKIEERKVFRMAESYSCLEIQIDVAVRTIASRALMNSIPSIVDSVYMSVCELIKEEFVSSMVLDNVN